MANLFDAKCPICGDEDSLMVQAIIWVDLKEDGTDADNADHEYGPDSPACCGKCGHIGKWSEFDTDEEETKGELQ